MRQRQELWDTQDLERRLCLALDVAKNVVERLAASGYSDPVDEDAKVGPEKIVGETALLLAAAAAAGNSKPVQDRVDAVARLLVPHAQSDFMLTAMCLRPALALDYATAHICLSSIGYRDGRFDAVLRQVLASPEPCAKERVPHRVLEQEWLLRKWGGSVSRRNRDAVRACVLNRPMDLLSASREDLYAFTHAVMYLRDFNVAPLPLPKTRAAILGRAEASLAHCLEEQDYDLAGEVLLAWPLTGKSWSPAAAFGFRVLAGVEDAAGFLPAPSTKLHRVRELDESSRRDYVLATAYHTVYVMGLLCAAALQPGRTPPAVLECGGFPGGSAGLVLEILEHANGGKHWWEQFKRLTDGEQDSLTGLLLHGGLRRTFERRDFARMQQLVQVAHFLGLEEDPAVAQAAEVLVRVAGCATGCATPRQQMPRAVSA